MKITSRIVFVFAIAAIITVAISNISQLPNLTDKGLSPEQLQSVSLETRLMHLSEPAIHDASTQDRPLYYMFGANGSLAHSVNLLDWKLLTEMSEPREGAQTLSQTDHLRSSPTTEYGTASISNTPFQTSEFFKHIVNSSLEGFLWTSDADGDGLLTNNPISQLSDVSELDTLGSWSPSVASLKNGNLAFYHSFCNTPGLDYCLDYTSFISVSTMKSINDSFSSTQTLMKTAIGQFGYDGNLFNENEHPSALAPEVFYDKEQRLWLAYGEYAGGIWIKELDTMSGLPLDFNSKNRGYGQKLAGSSDQLVRGTSIVYISSTDYYYLFLTHVEFDAHDKQFQSIRVGRSRNPEGPYYDMSGISLSATNTDLTKVTKLIGSHQWSGAIGEPTQKYPTILIGDSTVAYNRTTNEHYIYFNKSSDRNPQTPSVSIHRLTFNDDEWPVVMPLSASETRYEKNITDADVAGDYKLIKFDNSDLELAPSSYITLTNKGEIVGSYSGSYKRLSNNSVELMIDALGVFKSTIDWGKENKNDGGQPTVNFSGLSTTDGSALWGVRLPHLKDEKIIEGIAQELRDNFKKSYSSLPELPLMGTRSASIIWTSSNEKVLNPQTGLISRPEAGRRATEVLLSAKVLLPGRGTSTEVNIPITIEPRSRFGLKLHFDFNNRLNNVTNDTTAEITGPNLDNPLVTKVEYEPGINGAALTLNGSYGLKLGNNLLGGEEFTISYWMKPNSVQRFQPSIFVAANDNKSRPDPNHFLGIYNSIGEWSKEITVWNRNGADDDWPYLKSKHRLTPSEWVHVALSCKRAICSLMIDGLNHASGRLGQLTKKDHSLVIGVNLWDRGFEGAIDELKIYERALSEIEILTLDIKRKNRNDYLDLAAEAVLNDIVQINTERAISDISLPTRGLFDSKIEWTSGNDSYITSNGKITRRIDQPNNMTVSMTAKVSLGRESKKIIGEVVVPPVQIPATIVSYEFNGSLESSNDTSSNPIITGQLLTNIEAKESTIEPIYDKGIDGKALYLDGSYGIVLNDNIITGNSYSISMWLKAKNFSSFTSAVFRYVDGRNWVSIVPFSDKGKLHVWSADNGMYLETSYETHLELEEWVHIAYSVLGDRMSLYLNGRLVGVHRDRPMIFNEKSSTLSIGVNFWDSPFVGMIDQLMIFDGQIGDAEVAELYSSTIKNYR